MAKFIKYVPQKEKELHEIIKTNLNLLEDEFRLMQYEYPTETGIIDLLCVDGEGRIVIIEVKLHEDEGILFQALKYYSVINNIRYQLAKNFEKYKINPEFSPRIVLIAEGFSEDIKRLAILVIPEVELFEYTTIKFEDSEKGIIFHSVSLPIEISEPAKPPTIERLIENLKNKILLPLLEQARERIKLIGTGIDEYATQSYIGYRYSNGRQIGFIMTYRNSFRVGSTIIDEEKRLLRYEDKRIETIEDTYDNIIENICTSYINLSGSKP
jgi:hypothetical protein